MPFPAESDKFCGARINYRTKEPATCCDGRSDDCTFMMSDGVSHTYNFNLIILIFNSVHASVIVTARAMVATVAPTTLTNA